LVRAHDRVRIDATVSDTTLRSGYLNHDFPVRVVSKSEDVGSIVDLARHDHAVARRSVVPPMAGELDRHWAVKVSRMRIGGRPSDADAAC